MSEELEKYTYWGQVYSVYDGDTITVHMILKELEIDLGFLIQFMFRITLRKRKLRLYGIDTPELRGSEEEKIKGRASRDALREKILNKKVLVKTIKDKSGKYGRYLAKIYIQEEDQMIDVNEWLVEKGYAERRYY